MDDIVTRLRQFVKGCNHDWNLGNEWYPAPMECVSCIRQRDAADEIERLRLELEEQQYWNSVLKEQVKYII